MILHASLIATRVAGDWRGLLIQGPSGAGKSDLAFRALDHGFRLVADDRVLVFVSGGRLYGRSPSSLAGLIEVRGQGVMRRDCLPFSQITLSGQCVSGHDVVDRLPDRMTQVILGISLPHFEVWPFEPASVNKLCNAIEYLGPKPQGEYQAPFAAPKERAGA
jgi:serine kinase of HPr protein (carbohydrate metabolism regulator)